MSNTYSALFNMPVKHSKHSLHDNVHAELFADMLQYFPLANCGDNHGDFAADLLDMPQKRSPNAQKLKISVNIQIFDKPGFHRSKSAEFTADDSVEFRAC